MTQLLGAKELQFFVAYSFIIYDYVFDTKVDLFIFDIIQDLPSHSKLMLKLK
jgi:hypothetical protein